MKTSTVTEFRSKMKERLQEIEDDQDILILSGPKNRDFVVLTLERYNAMEETNHLLSTAANTARLIESIAQDKAGNYVTLTPKSKEAGPKKNRAKRKGTTVPEVRSSKKKK